MHRTLHRISFVLLIFFALLCPLLSFADTARSYVNSKYFLILDNEKTGFAHNTDGGIASALAVNESGGSGYYSKKRPGPIVYEPITVHIPFSMSKTVYQWISDSWAGKPVSYSGDIITVDVLNISREQTKFTNAWLTETTIPECNGTNNEPAYVAFTCAPQTALPVTPESITEYVKTTNFTASGGKLWLPSKFKLAIDGLDCSKVSKISPITVRQTESGKVEFSNLKITINSTTGQSWIDWHKDFILNGNNGESKEKNGNLLFMAASGVNELARIEFRNLGILSIRPTSKKDVTATIKQYEIELYCEQMVFKGPGYTATGKSASKNEDSKASREPTDDCQLGQTYIIGKENPLLLTVNSLEYVASRVKTGTRYTRPGVGEKLLVVHYTLQNPSNTEYHVGRASIDWLATDSNGVNREQDFVGVEGTGNALEQALSTKTPVKCFAVISMPAIGVATMLAAPAHAESVNVARYNLRDKVTALPAPFADPRDSTGSTPLNLIPGKVGVSYPVGDCDVTVESVEFSNKPIPDMELPENYIYVIASLKYTSFTDGASEISGNDIELRDVDGQGYYSKSMLASGTLNPITLRPKQGETVTFKLAFPIPEKAELKSLSLKSGLEYSVEVDVSGYKIP